MMSLVRLIAGLVLGSLGLTAFFLVLSALFPERVARTRSAAEAYGGRSLVIGLVNLVFFGAIMLASFALNEQVGGGVLAIPGLGALALLTVGVVFGLAGVIRLLGERLAPGQPAVRRTAYGTLALAWAAATPFIGWFLLLPYAAALGLGAFVLSFFYAALPEHVQPG